MSINQSFLQVGPVTQMTTEAILSQDQIYTSGSIFPSLVALFGDGFGAMAECWDGDARPLERLLSTVRNYGAVDAKIIGGVDSWLDEIEIALEKHNIAIHGEYRDHVAMDAFTSGEKGLSFTQYPNSFAYNRYLDSKSVLVRPEKRDVVVFSLRQGYQHI